MFDEGALKSGRPLSEASTPASPSTLLIDGADEPSTPTDPEGTADQPIDLVDDDDEYEDGVDDEVARFPPATPKMLRRPPSRPNLSTYTPPAREYDWLQPSSPLSTTSGTPDKRRKRSGKVSNLRTEQQRVEERWRHQARLIRRATEGGGPMEQTAGERVRRMLMGKPPARITEDAYKEGA